LNPGLSFRLFWYGRKKAQKTQKLKTNYLLMNTDQLKATFPDENTCRKYFESIIWSIHKRGKGTDKQCAFVAVERQGPVRSVLVESGKAVILGLIVRQYVHKEAQLMSDESKTYLIIGKEYAGHEFTNHGKKGYSRGDVHSNTAESFNSLLERAKIGVFHYMSEGHLPKYLNEIGFRWDHRTLEKKVTKSDRKKKRNDIPAGNGYNKGCAFESLRQAITPYKKWWRHVLRHEIGCRCVTFFWVIIRLNYYRSCALLI